VLISELVTNSIKVSGVDPLSRTYPPAGRTKLVAMRLSVSSRNVIAEVWDSDPNFPQPKTADLEDESGRGLLLVAGMAKRWGCYRPLRNVDGQGRRVWPAAGGKVVRFEVVIW
jgi:hypothetical protein